ncbi:MAG: DUF2975 domain-containing protein [Turicibacter sp.]
MKLFEKKAMSDMIGWLLNGLLLFGVVMTAHIYYTTFWLNHEVLKQSRHFVILIVLTVGIICTFSIVLDIKKIVKSLAKGHPFILKNVDLLNKIAIKCFIIAGCYFINIVANLEKYAYRFIYIDDKGIHTDTEIIIFLLAGVFILALSAVFKTAIRYKEENDFTI